MILYLLLQSCELAQRFRSSDCKVFPLPCFLMLLPQPAVIVPSLENARFIIGDEGTLLGLNKSEPVSHRNRRAAPQDTERKFFLREKDHRDRNKLDPWWNVRGMELFIFFSKGLIGFKWTFLNASNNSSKNGHYETTTKARLLRSQKLENANIENIEKPSRDKIKR